ncbi:MAG: hypothetical protein Kow0092_31870 [Deferrisomatales bacterium]
MAVIRSSRHLRLWAAAVAVALMGCLAVPHRAEARTPAQMCEVALSGGCCQEAAPTPGGCGSVCPCPCSQVPGISATPTVEPPRGAFAAAPVVPLRSPSPRQAPPGPIPIGG